MSVVRMWLEGLESTSISREAPGELSFGRAADLVVDPSDRRLHRILGRVRSSAGRWRLANDEHSIIVLEVRKPGSARPISVGPDSETALPPGCSFVRFLVGRSQYSICVDVVGSDPPASASRRMTGDGLDTVMPGAGVVPTPGQRRVLVAMCEPALRGFEVANWNRVPSNRDLAETLGISAKTVEKHVAELYEQFADAGVTALASTSASIDRRRLLVDHAIIAGVVTHSDIEPPAP